MRDPFAAVSLGYLVVAAAATLAVNAVGQVTSGFLLGGGAAAVSRPAFGAPSLGFSVIWALLYLLGAISFWRVLRLDTATEGRTGAIGAFMATMMLDACWTTAFFGLRLTTLALAIAAVLLATAGFTVIRFWRLDAPAGFALVPYLVWLTYAGVVNLTISALTG